MSKIYSYIFMLFNAVSAIQGVDVQNLKTIQFGGVCDETITESQFFLESPEYPGVYPPNHDCQLNFEGNECPSYYKFQFVDFNLEESHGCVKDRLEIGLVDALCGRKNGTKSYLSKNGTLTLRFKTDDNISEKGFKILVTRIEECTKVSTQITGGRNHINSNLRECCLKNPQTSRNFILKSPNFPASMSFPHDCILQIHKASPDICRLRITFQFFWLGNSLDCNEGFLQIDGKIICGCKKDLKLISTFDENVKVLRFRSGGLVKNSYSGFIAEVFQDDCPKKIRTDLIDDETILELPKKKQDLTFYTDEGYIYSRPEENSSRKEREMDDFLETKDIDGVLRNDVNDFESCLQWNQAQFDEIFYGKEIRVEQCGSAKREINEGKKCTKLFDKRGFFFSPGYPFFYPGNVRMCYRFNRLPGSCGVRMHFFDFRIDRSEFCSQDRLEIEGRSYCGVDLWKRIVTLDLRNKNSVELDFITSTPKCVQGFKAYYEYLPCEEIATETPPPPPITKILPVPPPTTIRPNRKCGGVVREEIFTLTDEGGSRECVFVVEKSMEDVCQLVLNFEKFSIDCTSEVIKINGKTYCGKQVGREVIIDAEAFPVEIIYSKFGYNANGFEIRGIQDTICENPEPPAQLN